MLMLKGDALLNLIIFSADSWIVLISVSVEFCESLETSLVTTMVNEPPGRLPHH